MLKLSIRPSYKVQAAEEDPTILESTDVMALVSAVDDFMRIVRAHEIKTNADMEERNALLQKHVNAAFDYYSTFSITELAQLSLLEMLAGGVRNEEE